MNDKPSHPLPLGFLTAGHACGIKTDTGKLDLALFVSDRPATSAGVFTQNQVVGAPVKVSRERVKRRSTRAVVINSGNSNACTGDQGIADAKTMTATLAEAIDCPPEDILVCSTGVIGRFLPMPKLLKGIPIAAKTLQGDESAFHEAARGMMTTDTFPKQSHRVIDIDGKKITIAGAAKGAAMIAPNMATMLAVIMTDAALLPDDADRLLRTSVDKSFNAISIDGHTSTSDTVLLLANSASSVPILATNEAKFTAALDEVCEELARMIIQDAEGAEHFVTVDVTGMRTLDEAKRVAKAICEGALVKTAITGNDPNWGRIVSAAGYTGIPFEEHDVSLWVNEFPLYKSGVPVAFDAKAVSKSMATGKVHIDLRFTLGDGAFRMWTSDLTAEYVRLNSEYTT